LKLVFFSETLLCEIIGGSLSAWLKKVALLQGKTSASSHFCEETGN